MTTPLHIVMTPTRNEAWCLKAFLETTTQWADYIIIADQMSTDGTREIIQEYIEKSKNCQVIMIDNTNPNFNEAERQAMLVAKAREVADGRDTLLWGLDADEILAGNAFRTKDWNHIQNSVQGDVFFFKWAFIDPDQQHYNDGEWQPWLFHDDGKEPHGNYVRNIHSMRIPYPIEEKQLYYVNDFRILHLAHLNVSREKSKTYFYQIVDWEMNKRSAVTLSRTYSYSPAICKEFSLSSEMYLFGNVNILNYVDTKSQLSWYDEYVSNALQKHPDKEIAKLDIWTPDVISLYGKDPRTFVHKALHWYFHATFAHKRSLFIRAIDKALKLFGI